MKHNPCKGIWSFGCMLIAFILTVFTVFPVMAADKQPLVKIGNEVITEADLKELADATPQGMRQIYFSPEGRKQILDHIINVYVVAGEAEKQNLDKTPAFQKLLTYKKKELLAGLYLNQLTDGPKAPTAEEAKAFFEKNKGPDVVPEQVLLHHILVPSEGDAKNVLEQLKKGEKFADIASKVSQCPSKEKGGSLGWLPKGSLVKEVEDVAFVVAPGQLSQPVKSGFGWHILFVEDKKPAQERTFDQVKDNVYQYLKAQKQQELTQQMRDSAKVEFPGQVAPSTPAPAAPK